MEHPKPFPAEKSLLHSPSFVTQPLVDNLDFSSSSKRVNWNIDERASIKEIPKPTNNSDGGVHQTNNICLDEAPHADSIKDGANTAVTKTIEGGIKSTSDEQPQLHDVNTEAHSKSPISLHHNFIITSARNQNPKWQVRSQIVCRKTNRPLTRAEYKEAFGLSKSQLGVEELNYVEKEYEVDSVEGYRVREGCKEYLVKWTEYEECTWEPIGNLKNAQLAVDEYIQRQPSKKRKRERLGNQAGNRKLCRIGRAVKRQQSSLHVESQILHQCTK